MNVVKQAFNPYLPANEHVPDGEPHVFGDRLYVFGSHDRFNGNGFCLEDYVAYSASVDNLADWRYEGVIFRRNQTPPFFSPRTSLWAPDVAMGPDGRYYLYYFLGRSPRPDNRIHVAVASSPAGPYSYYGSVHYSNGTPIGEEKGALKSFDPAVLSDEKGIFLYSGFSPTIDNPFIQHGRRASPNGPMCYRLAPDMLTVLSGPVFIGVPGRAKGKGTEFEGHEFFEASSIRHFLGRYYFIYSSFLGHELCYAISDAPDHGFHYGGTLISIGDIGLNNRRAEKANNYTGNTHGSVALVKGRYYVFYHRQTNLKQFSRQACAEELTLTSDGRFLQAETTSCGLNGGPLAGRGLYPARIACNLSSHRGTKFYGIAQLRLLNRNHPYFTEASSLQAGISSQYIANLRNGAWCGFKYFDFHGLTSISVIVRGRGKGRFFVAVAEGGKPLYAIQLATADSWRRFTAPFPFSLTGKKALYFRYEGSGHFDFLGFEIA